MRNIGFPGSTGYVKNVIERIVLKEKDCFKKEIGKD